MNSNNEYEVLETELVALRPVSPTAQLQQRIAERLSEPVEPASGPGRSRGPLWLAALCGPIAAVLTFFLLSGGRERTQLSAEALDPPTRAALGAAFDETLPSFWSYRRAACRSSVEFEALLDQHAEHSSEPESQRAGVYVLTRSQLGDFLGEL